MSTGPLEREVDSKKWNEVLEALIFYKRFNLEEEEEEEELWKKNAASAVCWW